MVYKTLAEPWTGSENDKFILLGHLEQLRKDSSLLSSEAVLPDLVDELAPVSAGPGAWVLGRAGQQQRCVGVRTSPAGAQGPVLTIVHSLNRFSSFGGLSLLLPTSQTGWKTCITTTGRNVVRLRVFCSIDGRTPAFPLKRVYSSLT